MNTCCGNCKTLSIDLKRCTGCFEIYYCSKNCQKQHWRSGHYKTCKGKTQSNGTSQKQDTGRHKASNRRPNDSQSISEARRANQQQMCKTCQKEGEVKVCKRCKLATYCSKECQTVDWPSHKEGCNRQRKTVNPTQDGNGSEQTGTNSRFTGNGQERHAPSPLFPGSVPFMFPGMGFQSFDPFFFNDGADLSLRYATSEDEWERARQLVKLRREFPLLEVIDDIDRIPHENFFGIRYRNGCVFLAFVWRYHPYRGRHCVFVQDINMQEIYVAFYLDYNNPLPFFTWRDVRPGRFIAIANPSIHYFADGSIGLRIEEPEDVMFLDP